MKPLTRFVTRPRFLLSFSTLILLGIAPCPRAFAQDLDDVSVGGQVADQNGAVIPGAVVTAAHASGRITRNVVTDAEGNYRLVELEPGAYVVRVSAQGFAETERGNLSTLAGQTLKLDFVLRPGGVAAEAVVVSEADAPPVDTTRTVVGSTITRAEIESLPLLTREALDFVFTLSGVSEEPLSTRDVAEDRDSAARGGSVSRRAGTPEEAGVFALSGGAASSNNVTIDGLDNNDDRAARERFQPSPEAVEEVQVVTNQFSAEYGRASGGRVNLRTRAGASDLRGRLFYFFADEALDANTHFNNARGLRRLPLQRHDAGFTLGGPLAYARKLFKPSAKTDAGARRTFFFVSYERRATLDSALIDALVPVEKNPLYLLPAPNAPEGRRIEASVTEPHAPAELAPFVERVSTPARDMSLTARVDHRFTDAHNATLLYQRGRARNLRQFGGGLRLAEALQGRTRDTDALAFTDNYVFSPTLVNQLRAQVSRLAPSFAAQTGDTRPVVLINIDDPLGNDSLDRSGTLVAGSSSSGASDRRETRWQLQNTLTHVRGAHTLKFGGDAHYVSSTFIDLTDANGTYTFTSAGDFLADAPARFRQRFGTDSQQRNTYLGFFFQDEWRARRSLTLSFGLRYENESIIRDRDNLGPRFGLAFDPTNRGRTVVRLGAGIFFNRVLLRTVDDFTLGKQVIEFDTNNLPAGERRAFIANNLHFPNALAPGSPLVQQYGARLTDFSRRLDSDLRVPESYQFNAGFERELPGRLVFETNYTFNRGLRLWREFNANAPRLPAGHKDFYSYLLSRDFANFRNAAGARPVYNASTAGELVRFANAPADPANPDAAARVSEFGVPVTVFNLHSVNSTSALEAALAALAPLRPDPSRGQIEQLVSAGNSFYHGLTVEARRRYARANDRSGFGFSFRAAYTLSRLIDDGVVNTSSALRVGDFRGERAPGLLDRRHRFALSGVFDTPRALGGLRLAPILRVASGAPFNLSLGGVDRNLDDVSNDRPVFVGDARLLRSRRPGEPLDPQLLASLRLPAIGQTGDLPRNAGRGPATFLFDLSLTREFNFGDRRRLRPVVEIGNVLNRTVFTFGAEFVNFTALRASATEAQRQALLDTFLVPTRTLRPRQIRLGVRLDF